VYDIWIQTFWNYCNVIHCVSTDVFIQHPSYTTQFDFQGNSSQIIYLYIYKHAKLYNRPYNHWVRDLILRKYIFFELRSPARAMASSFTKFRDHTQRRATVGRTLLDEWSARPRHLYLATHNTHKRQTSMHPVGFETMIAVGERQQT
jgi:hypothetical protein